LRNLNLDQLKAFVEVTRTGSFTTAAKSLNLSQPAVTHQVQELERRFKVALIERIGKRAFPTQAGETLIEHARLLLEESTRTLVNMRQFDDGWLGRVRVGTSMTVLMYALPPLLRQLKTKHPQLEITIKAGLTATTLQMLKTNNLDIGLCALPIEDPAVQTVPLFEDELYAIFPAGQRIAAKKVTPAFVSKFPLILGSEPAELRRTITRWFAAAGSIPTPIMEFDNVEAIKSMVAVGLGASIVPGLALGPGHVSAENIRIAPLSPRATRRIGLVQLKNKRITEGVKLVTAALLTLRGRK
jgi:DNA-binding transcriptional LysR family regulator